MRIAIIVTIVLASTSLGGCRPDTYHQRIRVEMPGGAEAEGLPPSAAIRPDHGVRVQVPADQELPRGVRPLGPVY